MKERPILMSAPMIRALLENRKTQTRRIIKPHPPEWLTEFGFTAFTPESHISGRGYWKGVPGEEGPGEKFIKLKYGRSGDRLWVREAWMHGGYSAPGYARKYKADGFEVSGLGDFEGEPWRPSIFMPRWASRITLEITQVRVERLQDISEEDAKAEGCEPAKLYISDECGPYVASYSTLWESINGTGSWDVNPWVWCVSFKKVTL